jgi:serine/threonine protein kinase
VRISDPKCYSLPVLDSQQTQILPEELRASVPSLGTILRDRYRLDSELGRGGMGTVYRAEWDGRDVALKLIAPELSQDREFRIRFQREYRAEASINHPNVMRVYGAGAKDGLLYVTMRYIDGTDLDRLLANGARLAPERAAGLIAQVASGLDAAHERGIVHRDVKPANVLLDGEHAILTDFGLMKNLNSKVQLTMAGSFVGTCNYASPEQLLSAEIDARTDVYALGCVLFQALTGEVPYPRGSSAATMFAHLEAPVPTVSAVAPDLPAGFDEVIARAMAKDASARFASAGELGRAAVDAAAAA